MNSVRTTARADSNGPDKLPWSTYLLTLCQAINLTAAVVSVTIAALVGGKLARRHFSTGA